MSSYSQKAYEFCTKAFRVPRAIVSEGNLTSFEILQGYLKPTIQYLDIPSGFDYNGWKVPNNWNLILASLISPSGEELIDLQISNLQVVVGSISVELELPLEQLLEHLHTKPELPDAIPYVTSYYAGTWGFCLPYSKFVRLQSGMYKVKIQVDESPGNMRLGEILIQGAEKEEIFFSTYFCHPQMANNELSGPALWMTLANHVWAKKQEGTLRYSYRFYIGPETIGAVHYLSKNFSYMKANIVAGFVLTCVGVDSDLTFMPSRTGNTLADRVAMYSLNSHSFSASSYLKRGSDERHWCSPAVQLPVCSIMTKKYHEYPEYHTSLDDLEFISKEGLERIIDIYIKIISILERNHVMQNQNLGEPRLDRLEMYPKLNDAAQRTYLLSREVLNILDLLDGTNDTLAISELLGLDFDNVSEILAKLLVNGIIRK